MILNSRITLKNGLTQNLYSDQKSEMGLGQDTKEELLKLLPLSEIYSNLRKDLDIRTQTPKYPVGLSELDKIIWGLHKKEVMVIGARTSHGKSAFTINTIKNLADKGIRIIYFSLEMTNEQLTERLLANLCEISLRDLREGKGLEILKERESIFLNWIADVKLLINDIYGYNFENIVKVCQEIKPDFIVIDYIQMISSKGFLNKRDAIEEFLTQIKALSMDLNFGAVLVSQINREGIEKPSVEHLKWAGILEEVADTILLLHWKWEEDKYFIYIAKQRHGECGKVEVKFEPQYSRFSDMPIFTPPLEKEIYK